LKNINIHSKGGEKETHTPKKRVRIITRTLAKGSSFMASEGKTDSNAVDFSYLDDERTFLTVTCEILEL